MDEEPWEGTLLAAIHPPLLESPHVGLNLA